MFIRLETIKNTEQVILIDEIGRIITTLNMIDFFCEYVNNDFVLEEFRRTPKDSEFLTRYIA